MKTEVSFLGGMQSEFSISNSKIQRTATSVCRLTRCYDASRYRADLRHVGLDDTRQGVLVGNGLGGIAQRGGPLHQLVGVGGAAQEAVAAEAVEFGVV